MVEASDFSGLWKNKKTGTKKEKGAKALEYQRNQMIKKVSNKVGIGVAYRIDKELTRKGDDW